MTSFRYAALQASGAASRGDIEAESAEAAFVKLRERGLSTVSLKPLDARRGTRMRLSREALAELLHELGLLLGAGANLLAALDILKDRSSGRAQLVSRIREEVASGRPLGETLGDLLGGNARFASGLISAGEATGGLAPALQKAAEYLRRDGRLMRDFWAAVSYPLFVLVASGAAVTVLLIFVVPAIAPLVLETSKQPPVALRCLIFASDILTRLGLWFVAGAILFAGAAFIAARLGLIARRLEAIILHGPARAIVRRLVFGRFTGIYGSLLAAGIAAPEAHRLAAAGVRWPGVRNDLDRARQGILDGQKISTSLRGVKGMPSAIVRLAVVGEETGRLGEMLDRAADIEQDRALAILKRVTNWIGPILIILLGLLIGSVMLALLTSISGSEIGSA